jgi:hypothetical protein
MKLLLLFLPLLAFLQAAVNPAGEDVYSYVTLTEWETKFVTSTFFEIYSESVTKTVNVSGTSSKFVTKTSTATFTNLITLTEVSYTMATMIATHYEFVTSIVTMDAKY